MEVETEVAHEAVDNRHDDEMKVKINSEVKILKLLFSEADVIEPCLSRLLAYDISADDLLNTDICTILYTKVYPNHSAETTVGKITRVLLKKFNGICAAEEDYDGDILEITEVNEPEKQPQKKRTFRNIFGNAERSQVLAPNNSPFNYDSDQEFSGVPCSTFVDPDGEIFWQKEKQFVK